MNTIFFYGLFMDAKLLEEQGLHPKWVGLAKLPDYQIRIGARATLVPSPGAVAYGALMTLSSKEAALLYAEPSVSDYKPEPVVAQLLDSPEAVDALCYNLPGDSAGSNAAYAKRLAKLVLELELPSAYSEEISGFAK